MSGKRRLLPPMATVGLALSLAASTAIGIAEGAGRGGTPQFERVSTFEVLKNDPAAVRTNTRVAEILAASGDGMTLIYVDSIGKQIGFLDISDPANPVGDGVIPVDGEPTSVAVVGPYVLVALNTSPSFVSPSGSLLIFDIATRSLIRTIDLGGQPDSVAVSPDKRFAAVVIENERNEGLNDPSLTPPQGGLPQLPAGFLVIIELNGGGPAVWRTRTVPLTGLADFAPSDPEPEYVDINQSNIAAVTLQENNHIVHVDLRNGRIVRDFKAGSVTLSEIDKQDNSLIELKQTLDSVPREPDAITWIGQGAVATANEGDMLGGSRGFTIYNPAGKMLFDVGNAFEHLAVRHGHYQEGRSDNKGTEPEGIEYAVFGRERLLFVGAERAGFVAVYQLGQITRPELLQILPTGIGPEGLLAIPQRNLFAVANEVDRTPSALDRLAGFRSVISLYELRREPASYPTIVSADRQGPGIAESGGLPIPWAALSALAADRQDANRLYTAHDSFFVQSRLYTVDVGQTPAVIDGEIVLKTPSGQTVNYDVEGVVQRANGGFWVVSEGAATAAARPTLLVEVAADGTIVKEVRLPASVEALQRQFGFEGVAVTGSGAGEKVYVAFQREWVNDPAQQVRIGVYTPADDTWRFFYYPIEPKNPAFTDAWVGLSELVALDDETFAVIERDNLVGEEAQIKRLYTFSIAGLTPKTQTEGNFPTVMKTLARDILPDLQGPQGSVMDKPEGLTVAADGEVYLVTDNDGVNNAPGETQFLRLGDRGTVFGK